MTKGTKNRSWDKSWENIFSTQEWGKYPPEELIRFVARNYYKFPKRNQVSFLDLGMGIGACSWYLSREGFSVNGIDGSKTAIQLAKQWFKKENLAGKFEVMDYIKLGFPNNHFDAVIDICSIQHNPIDNVSNILSEIKRVLKPHGKLFSMIVSRGTFFAPYENKGYVHFYTLNEIKKLFRLFNINSIEKSYRTENNMKDKIIHWIVTCER